MKTFNELAGWLSTLAGVSALAYAVSFIIISRNDPVQGALLSGLFLMVTGVISTAPWTALYNKLKETDPGFALWAFILGLASSLGMAIHGGYDLANSLNPPVENIPSLASLPSQIDPRGLLTFGIGGIALLILHFLFYHKKRLSVNLGVVAGASSILSLILYIGRLTILTPSNPIILSSALVNGFILSPLFYFWLGVVLRKKQA